MADNNLMPQGDSGDANSLMPQQYASNPTGVTWGTPTLQPVGPAYNQFSAYDAPLHEAPLPGGNEPQPQNFSTNSMDSMMQRRDFLAAMINAGIHTPEQLQEFGHLHNTISQLQQLQAQQEEMRQGNVPNDVLAIMRGMQGQSGGQ